MIELTTSLLMLASALTPMTAKAVVEAKDSAAAAAEATTTVEQTLPEIDHPLTSVSVEAYVRDYFKDTPILAEISRCESTFRQFDKEGKPLTGRVNNADIGLMQINTYYHGETAKKLGYDIYTVDGNLGFAKWLYGKYGDTPWVHSSKCWKAFKNANKEWAKI